MEDQLVQLLADIQSPEQQPRQKAEIELNNARSFPGYPVSLANIASHSSVATGIRQAALTNLRLFIEKNWNVGDADETPIPIPDESRAQLKQSLLSLVLGPEEDRKVKMSASYVVGKIAIHDFPDDWPDLLTNCLSVVESGNDAQLHGALKVLGDLVEESISEEQFFSMARDIAKALTHVALNESRKPMLRALAISIFRSCFDLMNMIKDEHQKEVKAFAEEMLKEWYPFFANVLKAPLPEAELRDGQQPDSWNSVIALKLQVVKTLLRIRRVFANLLTQQSTAFFSAVWEELSRLQLPYQKLYIENEAQARLEDADSLPYTLDFLILEEIDFLNQCFRAPPVREMLAQQDEAQWMLQVMTMLVSFSRVTQEEEGMWDIDCSLYLAEETSVTANYTCRTAAGDLLIKMGEWFNEKAVESLFTYTKTLFTTDAEELWRSQEAALYLFVMLVSDLQETDKAVPEAVANAYLGLVDYAISRPEQPLLKARGFLVAGMLGQSFVASPELLNRIIGAIASEESEVVQVACIKAMEGLITSEKVERDRQVHIITAIQAYMNSKAQEDIADADELLVTLADALRAAISLDYMVALSNEIQSLDLLFMLAKVGASNFQVTMIVSEAFEDVVTNLSAHGLFAPLCEKILPTLTGSYDVANLTQDDPLITVATELLNVLVEHGSEPLPAGFVPATLPKLSRLLMESNEGDVLRPGSEALKWILVHDHEQVLNWQDANGRSGLEVCLHIIDRLLGASVEDQSASEVGGLAAELVEKAGQERLGPFLPQLLQAVANRLGTAQQPAFIQSLILVFARLALANPKDVVDFLGQVQIGEENGLQVVLSKWLDNSINFAGYDEIRQNVIALSKIYSLNDPRVASTVVKGELIVSNNDTGRIKTRSQAKKNPDQYTAIPASLKIVKVLIDELLSASGARAAAAAASDAINSADFDDFDDDEDGWEDDDVLDLSLGATKSGLMSFEEIASQRLRDDETQAYLTEFFIGCWKDNVANFQQYYSALSEDEKAKLQELATEGQ